MKRSDWGGLGGWGSGSDWELEKPNRRITNSAKRERSAVISNCYTLFISPT